MGKVRLFGLAAALLASLVVTGCATVGACPAIAWNNTVEVQINGNTGDVATVGVCADGVCTAATSLQPVRQASMMSLEISTLDPQEFQTSSLATTAVPLMLFSSRIDERTWQVSVEMAAPETLTFRALSSAGEVLAEKEVVLEWRRVGGSEQCGGPGEAEPVSLDIPS